MPWAYLCLCGADVFRALGEMLTKANIPENSKDMRYCSKRHLNKKVLDGRLEVTSIFSTFPAFVNFELLTNCWAAAILSLRTTKMLLPQLLLKMLQLLVKIQPKGLSLTLGLLRAGYSKRYRRRKRYMGVE